MIEILVHLAVHNKIFGQQAQLTLAGWDEAASRAAASDPATPKEVLDYLISPKNLRPVLLPALLANPSVSDESLLELAPDAGREVVEIMLKSERITGSPVILNALLSNPNLTGIQGESIRNLHRASGRGAEQFLSRGSSAGAGKPSRTKADSALDEVFHLAPARII